MHTVSADAHKNRLYLTLSGAINKAEAEEFVALVVEGGGRP